MMVLITTTLRDCDGNGVMVLVMAMILLVFNAGGEQHHNVDVVVIVLLLLLLTRETFVGMVRSCFSTMEMLASDVSAQEIRQPQQPRQQPPNPGTIVSMNASDN